MYNLSYYELKTIYSISAGLDVILAFNSPVGIA